MQLYSYIIIVLLSFITTTITSVVGFADKIALIAVLALFIDIKTAIVITAIYSLVLYSLRILFFHEHLNKRLALKMTLFLIPGIVIGLVIFGSIQSRILALIFSIFLLLFVIYQLFLEQKIKFKLNELGLGIGMFLFGIVEASLGAAGPLLGAILLNYGKTKERFIVFAAVMLLLSSIFRLTGYAYYGLVSLNDTYLLIILTLVAVAGAYVGKYLLAKLSAEYFKYTVLFMLFLLALKGIFFS
jgi:uncharacterized membrane protein YfcA